RRLPILCATAGGTARIMVQLPTSRRGLVLMRRKRSYDCNPHYDLSWHLSRRPARVGSLTIELRRILQGAGAKVQESFHQQYIAYSRATTFACVKLRHDRLLLFLKLDPKSLRNPPKNFRDVTGLGTQC